MMHNRERDPADTDSASTPRSDGLGQKIDVELCDGTLDKADLDLRARVREKAAQDLRAKALESSKATAKRIMLRKRLRYQSTSVAASDGASATPEVVGFAEESSTIAGGPPSGAPRFLERPVLELIGLEAEAWLESNKTLVSTLPVGTVIIINLASGVHICGSSDDEAEARFEAEFGKGVDGFVHRVGRPTTVGGGWWALHKAQ